MNQTDAMKDLDERNARAVAHYWQIRAAQRQKQVTTGKADQGLRSAVTGGAHVDVFIDLFSEAITRAGIPERFKTPADDLSVGRFVKILAAHAAAWA